MLNATLRSGGAYYLLLISPERSLLMNVS